MNQKTYNSYYDEDGVKAMVARELTKLELSRNDMVKSLDIALNMSNNQLRNIIKNLSKNQMKTKFGQALKMILDLKEEHHL
jgi:hypothetical protein